MSFDEIKDLCHQKNVFIITNDKSLQIKLKEFIEHKLLKSKVESGKVYYSVPFNHHICNEVLSFL